MEYKVCKLINEKIFINGEKININDYLISDYKIL